MLYHRMSYFGQLIPIWVFRIVFDEVNKKQLFGPKSGAPRNNSDLTQKDFFWSKREVGQMQAKIILISK